MGRTLTWGPLTLGGGQARIAVPIVAATRDDLESQWSLAVDLGADLIEWRIDASYGDASSVVDWETVRSLRKHFGVPVLATVRTAAEGGGFGGSAEKYAALVLEAACWAEAVDVEQDIAGSADLTERAQRLGAAVVMSHHVFDRRVDAATIRSRLRAMALAGADIAKIAWMVSDAPEVQAIQEAQAWAVDALPIPTVVIGMGSAGAVTRLGESARLSAFTFAVGSKSSAPGQLSIDEVRASLG